LLEHGSDNQAVALEIQWDLVGTIEKDSGLSANALSCMRQPAKTQNGLTDLIRKDNVVSQLYLGHSRPHSCLPKPLAPTFLG
jgi:hypothetical protein